MACRLNPSHLLLLAKLEAKKGNFQSISQNILLPKKSYVCHAKTHKKTSSRRRCSTAAIMDRRKETETSELVQSDDIDIHYESRFDDSLDYKPRDVYNYFRRLQEEEKEKHCLHLQPNHLRPYGSTNGLYFPYVLQPLQSSSIVPQDRHASTLVFEKPKNTREFSSYRCEEITPENESIPYYHEDVLDERPSRSTIKSSTSRQSCSRFKKSSVSRTKFLSNDIHTRSISGLARTRNYSKVSIRKEIKAKKTLPKLYFDSTPKPLKEEMKDFLISPLKKKYETYYVPRKCEEFETVTKRADDDWKFIAKAFHKISDTPKPQYLDELKDCAPIKRLQKIIREEPKRVCEEPPNYCQKRSDDGMVFAKKKLKPLLASNIPEPIKAKKIETNKIKRLPKKNLMEPQKIRPITPKCSDNLRADKNLTISKYSLPKLDFTSTLPPPQRAKPDLTPLRRLPKVMIEPRKCKPPEPIQKCQRADDHWKMRQKRLPSIKGSDISPAKSEPLKVSAPLKRLIPKVFNYEAPKCKVEPVRECYRSDIDDWEFPSEIPEEFPKALVQKKSTSLTNLKRSMSTNISNHDYGNLLFRVSQTSFMDIRKRFSKSFSETIIPKVGIHLSVYRSCADEDDSRKRNVQPKYSKTHPFQPIEPVKPRTEIIDPIKEDECLRKQSGGSIRDKITGTCSNPKPKRTLLSFWKKGSTDDTSKSDPHCSKKMSNCSKSQSCPEIFKPAEKSSSSASLLAGCPEIFSPNCPPKPPGPPPCPPSSPSKPICPPKKPSKPICPPPPCSCPPPCPPPKSPPCPPPKPPPCPPPKSPPCPPPKSPPCPPKPKCPPPTPPKPKCPPPPPCPCPPPSPPCPCPPPCPPTSSKCQPTQLSVEPCAPSVSHERPPSFWQRFKNMFKSNPNCITPAQYRRNKKLKKMQKIASKSGFAVYDPCEDPEKICKEIEKTCEHVNKKGFCKTKKRCFSTYAALHSFSTASQGSNGIFNDLIISKNMVLPNYYLQKLFSSWRKPTHYSGEKMIEDADGNVDLDSLSETMLRTLSVEKLERTSVIDKSTALEHNLKNLEIKNMNLMERIQKALQNLENKQTSKDADSTKRSEDILKTKTTK